MLIQGEQSDALVYAPHESSYRERSRGHERRRLRDDSYRNPSYEYTQEQLDYHQTRNGSHYTHRSQDSNTYYIIPGGTNVIFQDENGNEITRLAFF